MLAAWQVFLSGVLLGITIAAPPGPVNAAAANRAGRSWSSVWLVMAGATTADGVFFLLTYYGVTTLVASEQVKDSLFLVGGGLMLLLAFLTLRMARRPLEARTETRRRYSYMLGLLIAISSPFQLAWWLTVGVGMISTFGFSIIAGFFSGIVAWTLFFATLIHASISRYREAYSVVVYASGIILAAFGIWFLYSAISGLV